MTEIIPPGKSSPNIQSAARTVVINELPEQFRNLDVGTIVEGKVIPSDKPQQVLIQTSQGYLSFISRSPYPVGTEVTLEVKLVGAKPAVIVLSATPPPVKTDAPIPPQATPVTQPTQLPNLQPGLNLPAQILTLQQPQALPPALSVFIQPSLQPPATPPLQPGQIPQQPAPQSAQPTPTGQPINAGQPTGQSTGQPTPTNAGQNTAPPAPGSAPPQQTTEQNVLASLSRSQPAKPGQTAPITAAPSTASTSKARPTNPSFLTQQLSNVEASVKNQNLAASGKVDAGSNIRPQTKVPTPLSQSTLPTLNAKIISVGEVPQTNLSPDTVVGRVVGQSRDGNTLLQIPGAVIRVPAKTGLPQQTPVTLKLTPMAPFTDTADPARIAELAGKWQTVQDAAHVLTQSDPAFNSSFAHTFQKAAQQMPALILFFMGALKSGDAKQWLGEEHLETLEKHGSKNLVDKLTGEFEKLGRLTDTSNEWRSYYIPLFDEEGMNQARLFIRHQFQEKQSDEPNDNPGTRFVLDVSLSRMGAVQLDGLIRQKRFDLTLRTTEPLDDKMQTDIREIYQAAHDVAGLNGQLVFSVVKKFPIDPLVEVAAKHPD